MPTPTELANAHAAWLLFGASGVTGRLILDTALRRGHRPALAGRNVGALQEIAAPHGLAVFQAAADDAASLRHALAGRRLVLNAGPFGVTAPPLLGAALAAGVDYLDVNGELAALEALFACDLRAQRRGVVLVGGAGFGVAASDGLAATVSRRLGGATLLRIAVAADVGFASKAVGESTLGVLAGGGREIACGVLAPARLGRKRWRERLDDGGRISFASAPLADLAAAARLTKAREIVAGVPMPVAQAYVLSMLSPVMPALLRLGSVRWAMIRAGGHAAGARVERAFTSRVWVTGEREGRRVAARLQTGEGFAAAATIAVRAVEALIAGRPAPGAYSPAGALGPGFIAGVPKVRIAVEDEPVEVSARAQPKLSFRRET
jgi:saccharopine dehydrogenase (NAD+, L-lysine-forming)